MRVQFLRGVVVGAVLVALAGPATTIAGTGIGAVFNLGRTNTVNHATVFRGTVSSSLLQVTNRGTGPALRLATRAGTAPMVVTSSTKVGNLNVDRLDGLDSTAFRLAADPVDAATLGGVAKSGFVQAPAGITQVVLRGTLTEPLNSGNGAILSVPGFGSIEGSCGTGGVPNYRLFWRNGSGGVADGWHTDAVGGTTYASIAANSGFYVAPLDQATDRVVTVTEALPDGRVATVTVMAHAGAAGCVFYAQAVAG